jgi:hypothetical protein
MAFERGERGYRFEQYPRRESERDRLRRGETRDAYGRRELDDEESGYMRSGEPRHWRGHDYYEDEDEFDRGRDYGRYDRAGERSSLSTEHRDRFLRRGQSDAAYGQRSHGAAWENRQNFGRDDQWSGPYAGRGPKGYRRSDERIHEEVCERLTVHPAIDASDIDVAVKDGDVMLSGRVESRAVKHLAETMVETVSGVKEIHNQLRVGAVAAESDWRREEDLQSGGQSREAPKNRRR